MLEDQWSFLGVLIVFMLWRRSHYKFTIYLRPMYPHTFTYADISPFPFPSSISRMYLSVTEVMLIKEALRCNQEETWLYFESALGNVLTFVFF